MQRPVSACLYAIHINTSNLNIWHIIKILNIATDGLNKQCRLRSEYSTQQSAEGLYCLPFHQHFLPNCISKPDCLFVRIIVHIPIFRILWFCICPDQTVNMGITSQAFAVPTLFNKFFLFFQNLTFMGLHYCKNSKYLSRQIMKTVQTQIRLLLRSSLIRVYTVCHSICSFWLPYCVVNSNCLLEVPVCSF